MNEQRVACAASDTGVCRWIETDPDDGRPCWNLCALDVAGVREVLKDRDA